MTEIAENINLVNPIKPAETQTPVVQKPDTAPKTGGWYGEKSEEHGKYASQAIEDENRYNKLHADITSGERSIGEAKAKTYETKGVNQTANEEAAEQVKQRTQESVVRQDAAAQALDVDHLAKRETVERFHAEQAIAAEKAAQNRAAAQKRADEIIAKSWSKNNTPNKGGLWNFFANKLGLSKKSAG